MKRLGRQSTIFGFSGRDADHLGLGVTCDLRLVRPGALAYSSARTPAANALSMRR